MNRKQFLIAFILTAGMLTACSSDDEQTSRDNTRRISVEVSERPMTPDDPANAPSMTTRGAITTIETFSSFNMRGFYNDLATKYTVSWKKATSSWTVEDDIWPTDAPGDTEVPFYAFTQGEDKDFLWNYGNPYLNFTIEQNASTQHDLLVAKNSVAYNNYTGKVGKVPLTFDHACAALAFNVFMSTTLKNQLNSKTLTVSNILLRNVSNTGRYYFNTPGWSDVSGSAYYTLNNSNIDIDTTPQALSSNYLFVIPQKRDANGTTGIYLDITYAFTGQTETKATIPLDVDWQAGYQYTINIKLGTTYIK